MSERTLKQALAHAEEIRCMVQVAGTEHPLITETDVDLVLLADEVKRLREEENKK